MSDFDGAPGHRSAAPPQHFQGSEGMPAGELRRGTCPRCGQRWLVHRDLAGFEIRCACGTMVPVAPSETDRHEIAAVARPPAERQRGAAPLEGEDGTAIPERDRALARRDRGLVERGPNLPALMVPMVSGSITDRIERGGGPDPQLASEVLNWRSRRSWLNRTWIELIAILAAFYIPGLIIAVQMGPGRLGLHPFASIISSVLILLIACTAPRYSFAGWRMPEARYLVEAVVATAAFFGAAWLYVQALKNALPASAEDPLQQVVKEWGPIAALFMVSVCPGIFEEIAFRGLMQSRFDALYGLKLSILYTGILFAFAHTVTLAFPIHLVLGFYLCWIRTRSRSVIPGIVLHMAYNACVLLLT